MPFPLIRRKAFLATLTATAIFASMSAQALTIKPFSATDLSVAQVAGEQVALHFSASWCPTCKAQTKALSTLKDDPALAKVTVLVADFDAEKDLKKQLNVRGQSTFIVYKGKTEVTRNTGEVEPAKLKALLTGAM